MPVFGQVRFESAALRFLLAPGDLLIVPPFVRHTASSEGEQPMEYGYAYFDFADPAMETDFATLFTCSAPVCLPGVLDEFHRQAAHHLIDQLDPQAPGAHLTAHLILEHLMLGMLRCQLNAAPELERALADPSATIQQLAEQYGYTSAAAFSHVFRQYFAVSPAAWQKGQRSAIEKKT